MSAIRALIYSAALLSCGLLWLLVVLFPLWDAKRQTLLDKLVKSVCSSTDESYERCLGQRPGPGSTY
jgi:hypothetical protein